jgi:hypothetical protein
MRIWFDRVSRADARKLARWWNGHTQGRYFCRKSETNSRFWCVVRGE